MGKESEDPDFDPRDEVILRKSRKNDSVKISNPDDLRKRTHEALKISLKYTELLVSMMNSENANSSTGTSPCAANSAASTLNSERQMGPVEQCDEIDCQPHKDLAVGVQIGGVKVKHWPPSLLTGAELRDYQLDGLRWLMVLDSNGANGILADEMGLGKTIQMIGLFALLIENNVGSEGPFLVISPLSTLQNWASEFAKFSPKIPVILYHGTKKERSLLRQRFSNMSKVEGQKTYPVVITSFEIPLRDTSLRSVNWRYIVIDEGHRLKNHRCLLIQELRLYRTVTCVLLTGTPLQNNLTELWSLLNFILPDIVQDRELFESWLDTSTLESDEGSEKLIEAEERDKILSTLHKILKPFILRRGKSDVGVDIPPKTEVMVFAPLSDLQKALYSHVVERSLSNIQDKELLQDPVLLEKAIRQRHTLSESTVAHLTRTRKRRRRNVGRDDFKRFCGKSTRTSSKENSDQNDSSEEEDFSSETKLFEKYFEPGEEYVCQLKAHNPVMALRKICNHPYLITFPVIPGTRFLTVDKNIINRSGKLQVLDELLKRLYKSGHKVLLFSNFIEMLNLLESYLQIQDYKYVRLDGTCSLSDRQENINKFTYEESVFVFLISTRAGGLGINLTAADTVIIFDSDWNPQVDLQAQDRCHRIGQTRPVAVYRLVVGGAVDEQIIKRAESKKQLEKIVIKGGKFQSLSQQHSFNLEELRDILKIKDNKVVFDSGVEYSEQQLDDLCDREKLFAKAN